MKLQNNCTFPPTNVGGRRGQMPKYYKIGVFTMLEKQIKMFGKTFEVKRVKGIYGNYCKLQRLEECYTCPSAAKRSIFDEWRRFFVINFPIKNYHGYSLEYGVQSYSPWVFTFDAVYRTPTATLHFHIAPTRRCLTVYETPTDFTDVQRALANIYD
jgi:hypothetical protein